MLYSSPSDLLMRDYGRCARPLFISGVMSAPSRGEICFATSRNTGICPTIPPGSPPSAERNSGMFETIEVAATGCGVGSARPCDHSAHIPDIAKNFRREAPRDQHPTFLGAGIEGDGSWAMGCS
jgi:hypothetical protein